MYASTNQFRRQNEAESQGGTEIACIYFQILPLSPLPIENLLSTLLKFDSFFSLYVIFNEKGYSRFDICVDFHSSAHCFWSKPYTSLKSSLI